MANPNGAVLVVVGGFPGSGKTTIARRLARNLAVPWLCSDTTGNAVRRALPHMASGDSFRAGYEVLFALTEELLRDGCSVVVDMSMGWEFQWQRLDDIRAAVPHVVFVPVLLHCSRHVCADRIETREGARDGARRGRFMAQAHLPAVWDYLQALNRPDLLLIDATRDPDHVYRETLQTLPPRLRNRQGPNQASPQAGSLRQP